MEEADKTKNPLQVLLEEIHVSNQLIQQEFKTFTLNQEQFISQISEKGKDLQNHTETIEKLSQAINRDISKSYQQNREDLKQIMEAGTEKIKSISVSLSAQDQNKINKIESIFNRFWKLPVFLLIISLVISGIASYLAVNFYSASVKSKEDLLSEYAKNGYTITKKENLENLIYNNDRFNEWVKDNPNDSKSFKLWLNKQQEQEKQNKKTNTK